MAKRLAEIKRERCVACGECVYACPRGAVTIVNGCYAAVDSTLCLGCGLCEKNCPAACILIKNSEMEQ